MPLLPRTSDDELVRRLRAGDERAFEAIDHRYRGPLIGYARRVLRGSEHDAQDVVQDVLLAAHGALRKDQREVALRPWLYRLTLNRGIDEIRRARRSEVELPDERGDGGTGDPAVVVSRREAVHRLVEDIAGLPERQRLALLARVLDGSSAEQIGGELGLSTAATQMLIVRARDGLVKVREARDADCADIREQLALARERGVRPSEHVRRHVSGCPACEAYGKDLRRLARRMRALAPPPWLLPTALLGGKAAGGAGKLVAGGALAAVVVAGAGITLLDRTTLREGDPAPFALRAVGPFVASPGKGRRLNARTSVVLATVEIAAGEHSGPDRTVTLTCPTAMRAVGPARPDRTLPIGLTYLPDLSDLPHRVVVRFGNEALHEPLRTRVGVVCRRADATGSYAADPRRTQPGERPARVCSTTYVYVRPGAIVNGTVRTGQPISVLRTSASGAWARIVADVGTSGWMKNSAVCPR